LEWCGRKDFRFKIAGQFVAAAEVESALRRLPSVTEAVCVKHEGNGSGPRLVAYLVCDDQQPQPAREQLRLALADKLPSFMIPSHFEFLRALPVNDSAKIDRRALEALSLSAKIPFASERLTNSSNPTEQVLCEIWKSVFEIEAIGNQDDFMELGGDSLQATRLVVRVNEHFQLNLTVRDVFLAP